MEDGSQEYDENCDIIVDLFCDKTVEENAGADLLVLVGVPYTRLLDLCKKKKFSR